MNVIVVPDAAMIVIPLIEKNGHTYLSPSDFSRYDNMDICEGNFAPDKIFSAYMSSEIPSGVRGRLFLLSRVIHKADAAIIIGKRLEPREKMYNALNDLILFGSSSCNNAHSLAVRMVADLNIPTLKLKYPTDRSELISLFEKTNDFLKNLENVDGEINADSLNTDLHPEKEKLPVFEIKKILNKFI